MKYFVTVYVKYELLPQSPTTEKTKTSTSRLFNKRGGKRCNLGKSEHSVTVTTEQTGACVRLLPAPPGLWCTVCGQEELADGWDLVP